MRTEQQPEISRTVMKLAEGLVGKDIVEGEAVIEMARKLLWMHFFSGKSAEGITFVLNAPLAAVSMAEQLSEDSGGSLTKARVSSMRCAYVSIAQPMDR